MSDAEFSGSRRSRRTRGYDAWTPQALFANSENGFWYDASDLTPEKLAWVAANPGFTSAQFLAAFPTHALYQDSAGTNPVTALGQPVGLVIDKSRGGLAALGPELIPDSSFDSAGDWTAQNADWVVSGGKATYTESATAVVYLESNANISLGAGKWYEFRYTISGIPSGAAVFSVFNKTASVNIFGAYVIHNANGTYVRRVLVSSAITGIRIYGNNSGTATSWSLDNISVREVPGVHASQSTSAARPTLQARVNLLTYSEEFDNAAWTKSSATITANSSTAPDGTVTADLMTPTTSGLDRYVKRTVTIPSGVSITHTIYAKASGINFIYISDVNDAYNNVWFNLSNGTASTPTVGTVSIQSAGNGWYKCQQTTTSTSTTGTYFVALADESGSRTSTASGSNGVLIWGADLRLNVDAAYPYQRVVTATDYADVGAPRGFDFDAVDDALVTASQSWATTKLSSFAGAFADAAGENNAGRLFDRDASKRAFYVDNNRAMVGLVDYATTDLLAIASTNSLPAYPAASVLSLSWNGGTTYATATLRNGGVTNTYNTSTSTDSSGAIVSDANTAITIGNRAAGDRTFDGRIYQLIFRDTDTDLGTIQQVERFIAQKSGVTL